jgi:tRNA (guanine10-N2)-dimethyltransferase
MEPMNEERFLFELSGEHPTLPSAELRACLDMLCEPNTTQEGEGYSICSIPPSRIPWVIWRLALTHRAGRYLGSSPFEKARGFSERLVLPEGTISVRVKRFRGYGSPEQANAAMRAVGKGVSKSRMVNLTDPDIKLRVILSDRLHFFLDEYQVDRNQYERRHVRDRPFFSPVSLHPRYARALVNLTRVREEHSLLDPFCGTGGILLEASLVGARVIGSDISEVMIEGCRRNLEHFGASYERLEVLDIEDVAEAFGEVGAVATDPPYGRSASTRKEPAKALHDRGLEAIRKVLAPGGAAGIVLPYACQPRSGLELLESHRQRVHRSLDRHYCLFKSRVS